MLDGPANSIVHYLMVAVLACAVAGGATPWVRRFAIRRGWVADTRGDRWHREPTAYLGGVALFLGFAVATALGLAWISPRGVFDPDLWPVDAPWRPLAALTAAGGLMFVVGLYDDLRPLGPAPKLLAELIAGSILISGGVMLHWFDNVSLDVMLSLLWFVAITNALNLLDNKDGLAGGIVAIAAFFLGAIFVLDGLVPFAVVAFALSGAAIGFLIHNVTPARIFMGDSGSLFLGIVLAGLALAPAPGLSRGLFGVVALPVLILAVPIMDTALVTAGRLAEGRPIYRGGRDHASHRLVALGVPERKAVWILWALAGAGGALGLLFRTSERAYAYLVGGVLIIGLALLGAFLLRVSLRPDPTRSGPGTRWQRFIAWQLERPLLAFGLDVALFSVAYYGAYLVRWEAAALESELVYFRASLAILIVCKASAFVLSGVYRLDWRFFALPSVGRVVRANVLGTLLFVFVSTFALGPGLSRGVVLIDVALASLLTVLARSSFRFFEAARRQLDQEAVPTLVLGTADDLPVIFAHLRTFGRPAMRPVGFVDTGADARSGSSMGVPRYGGIETLRRALDERQPSAVLLVDRGAAPLDEMVRLALDGRSIPLFRLRLSLEQLPLGLEDPNVFPDNVLRHTSGPGLARH